MRLLRASADGPLMFEEFVRDEDIPAYAILSHTWGNDEVTYKDMNKNRALAESKPGYRKIEFCAKRIRDDGIEHFWVDSCCINKSSSAELSEAINSMYRWYRNAAVCYTFLSDVPTRLDGAAPEADEAWWKKFRDARWFSRGWCLQELIAPQRLVFFSENGIHLGTKKSMAVELQAITGVPISVLVTGNVSKSSVAQRMSWAAHRSTSRAEDIAYCLMGIFEVNMAMLYGEGERAFLRLQEEIIKTSDDMSLFCWCDKSATASSYRGLLSTSPSHFAECADVILSHTTSPLYDITNKGIRVETRILKCESAENEFVLPLWGVWKKSWSIAVGVYLQHMGENLYARILPDQLAFDPDTRAYMKGPSGATIFFPQKIPSDRVYTTHHRASGIMFVTSIPDLIISSASPSINHIGGGFYEFANQSSRKAIFSIKNLEPSSETIVTIDVAANWFRMLSSITVQEGWQIKNTRGEVYCRKPGQQTIVIAAKCALFNGESRIRLTMEFEEENYGQSSS